MIEDKSASITEKRTALFRAIAALPDEDVDVVLAIAEQLPVARLVATCERLTDEGIEDHGEHLKMLPTPRLVQAQAALLRAVDAWQWVLGRSRPYRGPSEALHLARKLTP